MNMDGVQKALQGLIDRLEAGDVPPWRKAWGVNGASASFMPSNLTTGKAYRGVNILLLWAAQEEKGYTDNRWLTFKQCKMLGDNVKVRKGEKATQIIFGSKFISKSERMRINSGEITEDEARRYFAYRIYYVFNTEQLEGFTQTKAVDEGKPIDIPAYDWIESVGADIRLSKRMQPCYVPGSDRIEMPPVETFDSPNVWSSVCIHELVHWTGHKSRLDRIRSTDKSSDDYGKEELIAELGSVFACAHLGIEPCEFSPGYLDGWLQRIKQQPKYLLQSASKATQAVDYLQGCVDRATMKVAA